MIYRMIYRRVHLDGYNARAGSKPVLRTMERGRDSSESHSCDGTTINAGALDEEPLWSGRIR
jgi:hypothetical protein